MAIFFAPEVEYKAPTFQELVAPLAMYKQYYDQQEKEFNAQREKAAALRAMLGTDPNNEISAYMKDYNDLLDQTSQQYASGDMPYAKLYDNVRQLQDIWLDKGLKMTNAINADIKYKEELSKHPEYIGPKLTRMDFLKDPTRSYSFVNSNELEKDSANAFKSIAENMPPQYLGQFIKDAYINIQQGIPMEMINDMMEENSPLAPYVKMLQEKYGDAYTNLDDEGRSRIDNAIRRGAFAGLAKVKTMEDPTLDLQSKRLSITGQGLSNAISGLNLKAARLEDQAKQNSYYPLSNGMWINGYGNVVDENDIPETAVKYNSLEDYKSSTTGKSSSSSKSEKEQKAIDYYHITGTPNMLSDDVASDAEAAAKDTPCGPSGFYIKMPGGRIGKMIPVAVFDASGKDVTKDKPLANNAVGQAVGVQFDDKGYASTDWESSQIPDRLKGTLNKGFKTENGKYQPAQSSGLLIKTENGYYVLMDYSHTI